MRRLVNWKEKRVKPQKKRLDAIEAVENHILNKEILQL